MLRQVLFAGFGELVKMMPAFLTSAKKWPTPRALWLASGGLALLLVLVNAIAGQSGYLARRQQRRQIEALTAEIGKIKQDNARLTGKIQDLRTNPQAIEKLARERLRLGRPGEAIVTLPPAQQRLPEQPAPSQR
jgi:cell division protein FtsB